MTRTIALAFAAALGLAAPPARANLLINPSFEQPVLPDGTTFQPNNGDTIGAGWVVSLVSGGQPSVNTNGFAGGGLGWPDPTDGNQYLYMGNGWSENVYQDVTLAAGTDYRLTFDLAGLVYAGLPFLGQATLYVDIQAGGTSVLGGPVTFIVPPEAGFVPQTLDFTSVGAGTYQLVLTTPPYGTDSWPNLDNFSLVAVTPSAVPEPASVALLGLGAAGLAGVRLRRRA